MVSFGIPDSIKQTQGAARRSLSRECTTLVDWSKYLPFASSGWQCARTRRVDNLHGGNVRTKMRSVNGSASWSSVRFLFPSSLTLCHQIRSVAHFPKLHQTDAASGRGALVDRGCV